jgi:hypothetical protein
MPANAGIHLSPYRDEEKSWMPAFAGMTIGIADESNIRMPGITRQRSHTDQLTAHN